ncbi:alpha,alpha-phosphotrehalase [Virgibacillus halophilus]|uniref:Alpha,alpha-phosphotrehalase n=1 Tax=Tigheibacillus halophilus TaxID=361280 RepID=A0ABU5C9L7_9BACI|nr:alpha,alpha-phosphotrehalase [Virgibacillus halophilus]
MKEFCWKKSTVYQIYPKSFNDTTGNGHGDIQGIIAKLDYLQELEVEVIWLTPVYPSPQRDNGYDISDYCAIDERYGTMADFEDLLKAAHAREMKVIMDLVVNHTSTDHEWFQQAASSRDNPYRDFYIWRNGKGNMPPNNWQSKFGGSAWKYDSKTKQYYLHLFDETQADLNWENPVLREKIYDMMRFWAEKGIDGFRLDVINLISKNQDFPDDQTGDGRKFYTDGPKIHDYLKEMNQAILAPYNLITVGEMSSTTIDNCIKYTNPSSQELNMTFQFHHLKVDYPNGEKWTKAPFDFLKLKKILSDWQEGMHAGQGWNALFWCNHDQPRIVSRLGDDKKYHEQSAKMLATVLHMQQGTPYIYQGEEIGMTNPDFKKIADFRDVESKNAYKMLLEKGMTAQRAIEILQQKSRDNSRTPMQWSDAAHAGFTTGTPWIGLAENYLEINAKKQMRSVDSILYYYRRLIQLRKKYDIITYGDYQLLLADHSQIYAFKRQWHEEELLVVSNFYEETVEIDIDIPAGAEILISNYPVNANDEGKRVLRPYEAIVYYAK